MRNFLRPLCCLFAVILPLTAQSEPEAEERPPAGPTAWFACLAKPEGLENPVKIMAGGEISELELTPFLASDAVKTPADGILRIARHPIRWIQRKINTSSSPPSSLSDFGD